MRFSDGDLRLTERESAAWPSDKLIRQARDVLAGQTTLGYWRVRGSEITLLHPEQNMVITPSGAVLFDEAQPAPFVDISHITEYDLTQRLSFALRVF